MVEFINVPLVPLDTEMSEGVKLFTCKTLPLGKFAFDALFNSVPVLSGRVSVRSVLLFGLAIVKMPVPLALPASDTLLMLALLVAPKAEVDSEEPLVGFSINQFAFERRLELLQRLLRPCQPEPIQSQSLQ